MKYKIVKKATPAQQSDRCKRAHSMAKEMGLTAEEKHDLVRFLPTIPEEHDGSWKNLTEDDFHDLLTMLEGYGLITYLMMQRGKT